MKPEMMNWKLAGLAGLGLLLVTGCRKDAPAAAPAPLGATRNAAGELAYPVGTSRVGGGVATVAVPESDFFQDDAADFPVSAKEAEALCRAYIEKELPRYQGYRCRAVDLIRFKQGRLLQLFFSERLHSLDGINTAMAPDAIFVVTYGKKVFPPVGEKE